MVWVYGAEDEKGGGSSHGCSFFQEIKADWVPIPTSFPSGHLNGSPFPPKKASDFQGKDKSWQLPAANPTFWTQTYNSPYV